MRAVKSDVGSPSGGREHNEELANYNSVLNVILLVKIQLKLFSYLFD